MAIKILTSLQGEKRERHTKSMDLLCFFKFFFHNLLWNKVGFVFYYGDRGFGDRPKYASLSIFFDINIDIYY